MTSLTFYVVNYNHGYMRKHYECVVFTLEESDFQESTDWFFFQTIKKWHSDGCPTWRCDNDNSSDRCDFCTRCQNTIESIQEKWKNIQGTYYKYKEMDGKEIFIDNELLDAEITKIRYDVGGEEYENAVEKMKKLSNNYLDGGLIPLQNISSVNKIESFSFSK